MRTNWQRIEACGYTSRTPSYGSQRRTSAQHHHLIAKNQQVSTLFFFYFSASLSLSLSLSHSHSLCSSFSFVSEWYYTCTYRRKYYACSRHGGLIRLGETHCSCCHPERETSLALYHRLPPHYNTPNPNDPAKLW